MSRELTHFSYMVLGLVGRGGLNPYDLRQMVRRGRIYDWVGESQYYVEAEGLAALQEWARTPVRYPRMEHEPLTRILIADLVGEAPVRESLGTLRADIADLSARLDEAEAAAENLPHRRKYLLMGHRLNRRLLEVHLEWLDEIERELES